MRYSTSRTTILIHPNIGSVATSLSDLLSRLNVYGKAMQDFTGDESQQLILFLGISKKDMSIVRKFNFGGLRIVRLSKNSRFPILFSMRTLLYLKMNFPKHSNFTLIAGDLRASLFPILASKYAFRTRTRIQISIHGAVTPSMATQRSRKYFKTLLTSFAIAKSDSIRVVSQHLRNEVIEKVPSSREKIFISPIPILISNSRMNISDRSQAIQSFAIVGRLHPERGVIEALDYCSNILSLDVKYKLIIIGDGTSLPEVRHWIKNSGLVDQIQVIGQLTQDELFEYWNKIDLLVSNAPFEGYGMTIREAALRGCRILARRNSGTIALQNEFGDVVSLFENADDFQVKFERIKDVNVDQKYVQSLRENQYLADKNSVHLLVETWLVD
jgi:glycosyltransferase involved in cell wall biosynthesis